MTMIITVGEAAKKMSVRVDEIYRLIRSGRIRAVKVNGRLHVNHDSVVSHMVSREIKRGGK